MQYLYKLKKVIVFFNIKIVVLTISITIQASKII